MLRISTCLLFLAYAIAALGVAPVFLHLDSPAQVLFPLALMVGGLGDRSGRQLLPDRWATLASIVVALFYLAQLSSTQVVEPLVNLLVLLQAVRLVGSKNSRHLLQIFVLALFTLAASALLTLSMAYLVFLLLQVVMVTSGLYLLTFFDRAPQLVLRRQHWLQVLGPGLTLPIGSLLLMLVFFTILPRTEFPFWHFLNPGHNAEVGFSDQVRPGTVASLVASGNIAFRAEMVRQPQEQLYWRGIILNRTDGVTWRRGDNPPAERFGGKGAIRQAIYLEPKQDRYLVGLDRPTQVAKLRTRWAGDGTVRSLWRLNKRTTYEVQSASVMESSLESPRQADYYLDLPKEISPRLQQMADAILVGAKTREERINALEEEFVSRDLSYSSTNLPPTETPIETFLFETRRGYCEYFASSFAFLLRLAGVPARLVGGYLGGDYNRLGGYYLVPESTAHVWVEALDDQNRWRRLDPSLLAVNANAAFRDARRSISQWQVMIDAAGHLWNRTVIVYDLQQQFELARGIGDSLRRWRSNSVQFHHLVWLGIPFILWGGLRFWRHRSSRLSRLLRRYQRLMERTFGSDLAKGGLYAIAERTGEPLCAEFASLLGPVLYGGQALDRELCRRLDVVLKQLQEIRPDYS